MLAIEGQRWLLSFQQRSQLKPSAELEVEGLS
jgi:hypothetical protein